METAQYLPDRYGEMADLRPGAMDRTAPVDLGSEVRVVPDDGSWEVIGDIEDITDVDVAAGTMVVWVRANPEYAPPLD